jgi:UDP-N-acetylglucosamine--N-acetylmuramyl-(pentapeptide) pyrophosphoryl-undecaprenol N-acetylglucosamine transferase
VDRIFVSFADSCRHFPAGKTFLTGNPVRRMIPWRGSRPEAEPQKKFTLFIFGGSQGAHALNRAMGEALFHLRDWKGKMRILHQTGEKDYPEVQEAYLREGFEAEVHPFIQAMDRAYAQADLVLCRAGATTLFELMTTGLPAILVPYPHAANDHQTLNAQTMVKAGAAVLIADGDLTGAHLSRVLRELIQDPPRLKMMGEQAAALATPRAAHKVVTSCYEMADHE